MRGNEEGNDEMEIAMATGYMDARDAAYEALMFLVDTCGADYVLGEFFAYMDVDRQVEFVHDFIRYNIEFVHDFIRYDNIDTPELSDDAIRTIEEHYNLHC